MNKERFWEIIDAAREAAGYGEDLYETLLESLLYLEESDIIRWKQIFDEYLRLSYKEKLWAAAAVMHRECFNASFDYFRGWLIAQGEETFLKALADPDSLATVKAIQEFGYAVRKSDFVPLNGYQEPTRYEEIFYVASDTYYYITENDNDFYDECDKNPLSDKEKASISSDIIYPEDIDVKWGRDDVSRDETDHTLQKWLPKLYGLFNKEKSI